MVIMIMGQKKPGMKLVGMIPLVTLIDSRQATATLLCLLHGTFDGN